MRLPTRSERRSAPRCSRDARAQSAEPAFLGENPKKPSDAADEGASNRIKDPDDWVTGDEPMTGAQASYLKTLSEEAHEPDAFDPEARQGRGLQAHRRLKEKLRR